MRSLKYIPHSIDLCKQDLYSRFWPFSSLDNHSIFIIEWLSKEHEKSPLRLLVAREVSEESREKKNLIYLKYLKNMRDLSRGSGEVREFGIGFISLKIYVNIIIVIYFDLYPVDLCFLGITKMFVWNTFTVMCGSWN